MTKSQPKRGVRTAICTGIGVIGMAAGLLGGASSVRAVPPTPEGEECGWNSDDWSCCEASCECERESRYQCWDGNSWTTYATSTQHKRYEEGACAPPLSDPVDPGNEEDDWLCRDNPSMCC